MSSPLTAWRRLRSGIGHVPAHPAGVPGDPTRGRGTPGRPTAVVFRCADHAVAGDLVFGQGWGSLVEVSTWGHAIDRGVMASLEYAVEVQEVPLIVVLGHHDCEAMRAATRAWNDAALPDGACRSVVEHVMGAIVRRGTDAGSVEAVSAAHAAETGLALLERSPVISRRVDARKCGIVCVTVGPDGTVRTCAAVGPVGEDADSLLECV